MKYLFICYPRCSTCQKAKKWLEDNKIDYDYRHIAKQNPTVEELQKWIPQSGLPIKKFFNTSGKIYREMGLKNKIPQMTDKDLIALLSTDGMLVKRPLLIGDNKVLVGFNAAVWESINEHK